MRAITTPSQTSDIAISSRHTHYLREQVAPQTYMHGDMPLNHLRRREIAELKVGGKTVDRDDLSRYPIFSVGYEGTTPSPHAKPQLGTTQVYHTNDYCHHGARYACRARTLSLRVQCTREFKSRSATTYHAMNNNGTALTCRNLGHTQTPCHTTRGTNATTNTKMARPCSPQNSTMPHHTISATTIVAPKHEQLCNVTTPLTRRDLRRAPEQPDEVTRPKRVTRFGPTFRPRFPMQHDTRDRKYRRENHVPTGGQRPSRSTTATLSRPHARNGNRPHHEEKVEGRQSSEKK